MTKHPRPKMLFLSHNLKAWTLSTEGTDLLTVLKRNGACLATEKHSAALEFQCKYEFTKLGSGRRLFSYNEKLVCVGYLN